MKKVIAYGMIATLWLLPQFIAAQKGSYPEIKQLQGPQNPRLGFVIHGGAGVITRGSLTPEKEKEIRAKLEEVLMAGYKTLHPRKKRLHSGQIAIRLIEHLPLFNPCKEHAFIQYLTEHTH